MLLVLLEIVISMNNRVEWEKWRNWEKNKNKIHCIHFTRLYYCSVCAWSNKCRAITIMLNRALCGTQSYTNTYKLRMESQPIGRVSDQRNAWKGIVFVGIVVVVPWYCVWCWCYGWAMFLSSFFASHRQMLTKFRYITHGIRNRLRSLQLIWLERLERHNSQRFSFVDCDIDAEKSPFLSVIALAGVHKINAG